MLSNEDIYKSRDVTTAETVAQMAQLKYFDEQYLYYACAYLKDGQIRYRLHENADKMYAFWEKSEEFGIYPTDISKYVRLLKTPSGHEQEMAEAVQKEFAHKLAEEYPPELFLFLQKIGAIAATDSAAEIFYLWQDDLELCYSLDQIELFSSAAKFYYDKKLLKKASYTYFADWARERKELINSCECSIWREKRMFYGFMSQDGAQKIYSNASEFIAHEHRYELMSTGVKCTPIFRKYYWLDEKNNQPLKKWRSLFEENLSGLMDENYQKRMKELDSLPPAVAKEIFAEAAGQIDIKNFPQAKKVLGYYRTLWL